MLRARKWNPIPKDFLFDDRLNDCSIVAELIFVRLIAQADDLGNYYGDPALVASYLLGHRLAKGEVDVDCVTSALRELEAHGLLMVYKRHTQTVTHIVDPPRKLRSDVMPDIRFPLPENAMELMEKEGVPKAIRKRIAKETRPEQLAIEFGPLDPDPDPDPDPDLKALTVHRYGNDFEEFWAVYPRTTRMNKLQSFKAWQKCLSGRPGINGHPPVDEDVLIAAAGNYAVFCANEKRPQDKIMYPATFLGPNQHWVQFEEEIQLESAQEEQALARWIAKRRRG